METPRCVCPSGSDILFWELNIGMRCNTTVHVAVQDGNMKVDPEWTEDYRMIYNVCFWMVSFEYLKYSNIQELIICTVFHISFGCLQFASGNFPYSLLLYLVKTGDFPLYPYFWWRPPEVQHRFSCGFSYDFPTERSYSMVAQLGLHVEQVDYYGTETMKDAIASRASPAFCCYSIPTDPVVRS